MRVNYLFPFFIAVALITLVCACHSKNDYTRTVKHLDALGAQDTILYMSTSACFGLCAQKESIITGDKVLNYHGIKYADPMGKISTQLNSEDIQALFTLAENANFYNLDDRYPEGPIADAQLMRLGIRYEDSIKYVDFEMIAPDSIRNLFLGVDRWIQEKVKEQQED